MVAFAKEPKLVVVMVSHDSIDVLVFDRHTWADAIDRLLYMYYVERRLDPFTAVKALEAIRRLGNRGVRDEPVSVDSEEWNV